MTIAKEIVERVAEDTGIDIDKITTSGFLALLREKKYKIMANRLDVLARYNVTCAEEIEKRIKEGKIPEHPAWEDLILLDNLELAIARIDEDIKTIQKSS